MDMAPSTVSGILTAIGLGKLDPASTRSRSASVWSPGSAASELVPAN
jgi:hypothetical protein